VIRGCLLTKSGHTRLRTVTVCWLAFVVALPFALHADRPGICPMASGVAREGEMRDAQIITGGPFTSTVVVPAYTCRGGYWVCSRWCPPGAEGVRHVYRGRRLLQRYR
jgi:hypothetical protein